MGTIKSAKEKRDWIWDMVNSQGICGLGYDEEQLINTFCMVKYSTRKTCKELLKEFEMNDKIIRKNGKVYSRLFFNPDLTLNKEVFKEPDDEPLTEKRADEILAREDLDNDKIIKEVKPHD